jgi:OPA family glycerol-3-phosphate transporter-like MFS transporter
VIAGPPAHDDAFRRRRFLNWFPMGLTYALLYMGRYNLTVSKTALGALMTKEDFGVIFGVGTLVYAFALLLNGPLTDRFGGKRALLAAALGSGVMNLAMGLFVRAMLHARDPGAVNLRLWMSLLYAANMYFQCFGAVAVVKVNAHWFHVRERGGFSGIFGTMIASGIFFAFTANGWILGLVSGPPAAGPGAVWWVFFAPAGALLGMFVIEAFLLRDRPAEAGLSDFETGDASSGEDAGPVSVTVVARRILTNPVLLTVAAIEFCTGVLRQGVMHWFPFYANEVWALPGSHPLVNGSWGRWGLVLPLFGFAAGLFLTARAFAGKRRAALIACGALAALAPFLQAGWGGLLFVAGVIGGNVAGWVSDLFFQSRRAPAAGGLYAVLAVACAVMVFTLGGTTTTVGWVKDLKGPLQVGDRILAVGGAGGAALASWDDVARAVACVPSACEGGAVWNATSCGCAGAAGGGTASPAHVGETGGAPAIPVTVERAGATLTLAVPDKLAHARAGDRRKVDAGPVLTLWPYWLGLVAFLISICVIGTHGVLSGTATMDFGGRRGAATAVAIIDGAVYLGTGAQSLALGYLTTRSWIWWPLFLLPFALLGAALCTRIWHARPQAAGGAP